VLITLTRLAYQVALGICRPVAAAAASFLLGLTVAPQAPCPQTWLAPEDLSPARLFQKLSIVLPPVLSPRSVRMVMQLWPPADA
jgi:hypothetical protein